MLVLTLMESEQIRVGESCVIRLQTGTSHPSGVRIAFEAPKSVSIRREPRTAAGDKPGAA